jgi:beta-galactosidase
LLLDGDPGTIWHTPWGDKAPGFPHEVVLRFDQVSVVQGLLLLPRQDGNHNGWIKDYAVYVSSDVEHWREPVARGSFAEDPLEKRIKFERPAHGKFLKFVALSSFNSHQPFASLAELSVLSPSSEK